MDPEALPWSDAAVWSACHGLGVLLLDGPLRYPDPDDRAAASERLFDLLVDGLIGHTGWAGSVARPE